MRLAPGLGEEPGDMVSVEYVPAKLVELLAENVLLRMRKEGRDAPDAGTSGKLSAPILLHRK